jgi:glutamate-1-semialdehyde 2,1-aminomutase
MVSGVAGLAVLAGGALAWRLPRRLALSRAKHRSLAGHARIARAMASLVPYYEFVEADFVNADDAPGEVAKLRRAGFERLAALYAERFPKTRALTREVQSGLSDLQFTAAYRVPFQFSRHVRTHLGVGAFLQAADRVTVTDLDGNSFYDLAGSYGVNLLGYDFYKKCVAEGMQSVQALGPVLGAYHPEVAYNVARLRAISGLDEVSFHMSGTEAVMQAVRLARFHTRRTHVVQFAGAYHGWWGDVQPGIGNPVPARETYILADMSDRTLHVLRKRHDIACVLVNPLQALHPNQSAPSDSALVDGQRSASFDRVAYSRWLHQLREVCTERGIPLIFDEVFVGFRLAPGGAAEFFGVQPDLVTYGKTLGGGLPVGVVCGRRDLMRRYRDDQPGDICLARGTFNANPYVMGTMAAFLRRLEAPEVQALYDGLTETWDGRAAQLNAALAHEKLPLEVANLSTIWTVCFKAPSRYNWMLQYYLRAEGLLLSWVGSGRIIFSLNYTEQDFAGVVERFLAAARAMARDGWWWNDGAITGKSIRRRVLREILRHYRRPRARLPQPV